jgi:hypothetical protein
MVFTSGSGGVTICGVESQSSTSTPEGVLLFQLIPMTKKASNPKCAMSEKVNARLVLSSLVSLVFRPRLKGEIGF